MKQRHSKPARYETVLFPAGGRMDAMTRSVIDDRGHGPDPERE
jgi:hypothetical protein